MRRLPSSHLKDHRDSRGTVLARETSGGTIYVARAPDGTYLANVVELPGCIARGTSPDEAVARVREAFRDYVDLMRTRGVALEHVVDLDPAQFTVKEPEARHTYPEDFRRVEEHELRDFLHQYEASRAALLALVRGLSSEQLERKPTPDSWSVRECLEHIAATEATLLTRLEAWPESDFAAIQAVHRMAFQRFSVMEPDDTDRERRILGQRWSARKVMRRLLEHEYEHLRQIREVIEKLEPTGP
jgi:predicted RNase H-like HicB family nuclease